MSETKQTPSYQARYESADSTRYLLGGVRSSASERYSHKEDAQARLDAAISIHAELLKPLQVIGSVVETPHPATIKRHCLTPQAVGCRCPECGVIVR